MPAQTIELECLFKRGVHAEATPPDFVLLDWNLPNVSGEGVLRMLRATEELRALPVIVFSSSEADYDVRAAYNAQANGYVSKPANLDAIFSVIESIENFWVHTARLPSTVKQRFANGLTP